MPNHLHMSRIHKLYAGTHCILDFYPYSIISLLDITQNPDMNKTILLIISIAIFIVSFQADPFLHEFHGGGLAPAAQFFSHLGQGQHSLPLAGNSTHSLQATQQYPSALHTFCQNLILGSHWFFMRWQGQWAFQGYILAPTTPRMS